MSTRNGLLFCIVSVAAILLILVLYLVLTTLTFGSRAYAQEQETLPVASLVSVSPNPVREGNPAEGDSAPYPGIGLRNPPRQGRDHGVRLVEWPSSRRIDRLGIPGTG